MSELPSFPTGDVLLLSAIGALVTLALVFLIAAVRSRKSELVDKRLGALASVHVAPEKKLSLPARIDLEIGEASSTPPRKNKWSLPLAIVRKQALNGTFVKAGLNPKRARPYFLLARCGGSAAATVLAAFLAQTMLSGPFVFAVVFAAGVVGSFLPHALLRARIRQRQKLIERAMPDMVDLLILCVEAGLTLEVALARAIEGLEPFAPELAAEMKTTLSELKILPDKSMALTNLERRTASKSLKYLVLSLRQSERYGTSITGALKTVAVENRKHAMLELENNAARMPTLLSVPLILFILPPVVALSAGPGFALMMRAIGG